MNPFFPEFWSAFYHSKETKQRQILTFQAKCDFKYNRGIVIIGVTSTLCLYLRPLHEKNWYSKFS